MSDVRFRQHGWSRQVLVVRRDAEGDPGATRGIEGLDHVDRRRRGGSDSGRHAAHVERRSGRRVRIGDQRSVRFDGSDYDGVDRDCRTDTVLADHERVRRSDFCAAPVA